MQQNSWWGLQTHQQPLNSSSSHMIADLGLEPLNQRRANAKLVMVYRITYGLIYIPASLYLHPATLSTRGHTLRYLPLYCMTDVYGHSFPPLPSDCRTSCRKASWLPQPDIFGLELASQDLLFQTVLSFFEPALCSSLMIALYLVSPLCDDASEKVMQFNGRRSIILSTLLR